jgi:hypothetical protein
MVQTRTIGEPLLSMSHDQSVLPRPSRRCTGRLAADVRTPSRHGGLRSFMLIATREAAAEAELRACVAPPFQPANRDQLRSILCPLSRPRS